MTAQPSPETEVLVSQSATATQAPTPAPIESLTARGTATAEQTVAVPAGLQIVYLQNGNLWFWTGANNNVMLTGTSDLSVVRLAGDGQLLAFMRGPDVWTIRMDGTDAHALLKQDKAGGLLSFAPDGSILAVSTSNHIDLIDLQNSTSSTVLTYPVLVDTYYPEVVWSADGTGFKTVIPPNAETGRAEFLFVFADGKKASLAKFDMVPPAESPPFISPDGGYVIYIGKQGQDKEALLLMDSSGASKPYGEAAQDIRAYGWLPDSTHFLYGREDQERMFMGDVTGQSPMEMVFEEYETIRWIDPEHFLAMQAGSLYVGDINGGKMLIAEGVSDFDFGK